ncbi:nitroreductase [archaeon]|nr:MAG: nitroreductase [archaeon]HDM23724.1 nitroreductase [Candidatus Bathyarchaeota archaeon]
MVESSVFDVIKRRRSVRRYLSKDIPEEYLKLILESGRLAPSSKNSQPWSIIVVRDEEIRRKLAEACMNQLWIAEAPVILVICGHPDLSEKWWPNCAICMDHMILTATDLGLGTCWIAAFDEEKVKEILGIPDNVRIAFITPVGYPAESPPPRPRRSLNEIVHYERW